MEEVWKKIKDTYYEVSNIGKVRNIKTLRVLKTFNYKGYSVRVYLYINKKKKQFKLHRLVAEAFIPNPENKPEVDHIDRDPTNNTTSNLRWATRKENCKNRVFNEVPKGFISKIIKLHKSGMNVEDIQIALKK